MPVYAVRLEGTCLQKIQERRWLIFRRIITQPVGFFTTRWVEATTIDYARDEAIRRVVQELAAGANGWVAVDSSQPTQFWVETIWEEPLGLSSNPSGGAGFSFFSLNDEARDQAYEIEAGAFETKNPDGDQESVR